MLAPSLPAQTAVMGPSPLQVSLIAAPVALPAVAALPLPARTAPPTLQIAAPVIAPVTETAPASTPTESVRVFLDRHGVVDLASSQPHE